MYESPINLWSCQINDEVAQKYAEHTENLIYQEVLNVGVSVDRKELIKALEYDRDQYRKGYADGEHDALEKYRPTGKWTSDLEVENKVDNRLAEPIDITDENARFHFGYDKEELIHCPHCGCTISSFTVMPHHYCYVCGGRFGENHLTYDEDEGDTEDGEI